MNPKLSFRASISFAASRRRVDKAGKSMEGGGVSALRGRKSTTTVTGLFPQPSHISGNPRRTAEAQRLCEAALACFHGDGLAASCSWWDVLASQLSLFMTSNLNLFITSNLNLTFCSSSA